MSEMVELVARAITAAFAREGCVFEDGQADTLANAALDVMLPIVPGLQHICSLSDDEVVVAHPKHEPVIYNFKTGKTTKIRAVTNEHTRSFSASVYRIINQG